MPQPASATPPAAPALGPVARQGVGQFLPAANVAAMRSAAEVQPSKEGGAFIDHALRERVDGDIAAFLAAFDAALDHDTAESRSGLREATDRLLRAGARTRIELEAAGGARTAGVAREERAGGARLSPALIRPRFDFRPASVGRRVLVLSPDCGPARSTPTYSVTPCRFSSRRALFFEE